MTVVYFDQTQVTVREDESVLDSLLNHKIDVPFGCKNGVCQSCMLQASDGAIPQQAQKGLTEMQTKQGYFLACQCHPTETLYISSDPIEQPSTIGQVIEKEWVSPNVIRLRVRADLDFKPGQFINLKNPDGVIRSYSIASLPHDGILEFHIKHIAGGRFSDWVKHALNVGDSIELQGPLGECYLKADDESTPLVLAAMNTGLAPVLGILKNALAQQHQGAIRVFIGAKDLAGHYLVDEINDLVKPHDHVQVHRVCLEQASQQQNIQQADIYHLIKSEVANTKGHQVYLCGAESFVKKLKKQCFLAGANMGDIFADAFVAAG